MERRRRIEKFVGAHYENATHAPHAPQTITITITTGRVVV